MTGGVFLDRDGVSCENRADYVKTWTEFRWIPRAQEALRLLAGLEMPVVLVTNQSAINRGLTTSAAVHDIHRRMADAIRESGGRLDGVYLCPHRPDEGCACRKPGVRLYREAADDLALDLEQSFLIGDNVSDLQAAWALEMRAILVRTGLGSAMLAQLDGDARRVRIVGDVLDAAQWVERALREDLSPGLLI